MKKKLLLLVALGIMSLSITACGKEEADPIKEDLEQYLSTDLPAIQGEQQAAIDAYNNYFTQENPDSQELLTALNTDIIPKYEQFLSKLSSISPETEEVNAIKEQYYKSCSLQYDALVQVAKSLEDCDSDLLEAANDLIKQSKSELAAYESQLNILASEHQIILNNGTETIDLNSKSGDANETTSADTQAEDTTEAAE